ncbi:MAG: MBL fold metallo-hydrolase [Lachnospiraceae bacterium]|nr:MBL fold metallo-hydrolase [Lachnospiraceae bacterium]
MKRIRFILWTLLFGFALAACGKTTIVPEASGGPRIVQTPTPEEAPVTPTAGEAQPAVETPTPEEPEEALPTEAEEAAPSPAELLYLGHASLRIKTAEGKFIYVDPFFGNAYDQPADLILRTHSHYDHADMDKVSVRSEDCVIITEKEALAGGSHQSSEEAGVQIEAVEAGNNANHSIKNCVGYVLTFSDGVRLYISGDTSETGQMKELKDIDYAFFCCDGVYNMGMEEASRCAALVGAAHSIPYHMVPSDNTAGFDRSVAERFEAEGRIILEPGEILVLEK